MDNLILGVRLADILTRRFGYPREKVKQSAKMMAFTGVASELARACSLVWRSIKALTWLVLPRLELTLPPNFFIVVIQQPGNS